MYIPALVVAVALVLFGNPPQTSVAAFPSSSYAADRSPDAWPLDIGGPAGGRSTQAAPALEGEVAWRMPLDAAPSTPMVADADRLYLGLRDGALVAMDAARGRVAWRVEVPGQLDAAPAVAGDRLFVAMRDGQVLALDSGSGATLWTHQGHDRINASPLVAAGAVFVASNDEVRALDAALGNVLWQQSIADDLVLLTPALHGDRLVVATYRRLYFLDRLTGRIEFRLNDLPFASSGSIALAGDSVFAITDRELLLGFDQDKKRPWWEPVRRGWEMFHLMGMAPEVPWQASRWEVALGMPSLPLAVDQVGRQVIVASPSGRVQAYDLRSGGLHWSADLDVISAAPLVTSRGVLVSTGHALVLLDPWSGAERQRRRINAEVRDAVVTRHGTYVVTGSDEVLALRGPA